MTTAYLIVYGADPTDRFAAYKFNSRQDALKARLTPSVPVDGFGRPKPDGEVRPGVGGCSYVVEKEEDVPWALPMMVAVYNALTGEAVKRFADRPSGVKRVFGALAAKAVDAPFTSSPEGAISQSPQNQVEGKKMKGRAPAIADDTKIKVVSENNPKRAGSKAATYWPSYKDGATVAELVAAGVPRGDINYNLEKGYIQVG